MTRDLSASSSTGKTDHRPDEISLAEIERVVAGQHHDPHSVLGAHLGPRGVTIRALRPMATAVTAVLADGSRHPLRHRHQGVFEVRLPESQRSVPDYLLEVTYPDESSRTKGTDSATSAGSQALQDDPYRHLPTLGEFDLHLISEGRHEQLWRVLGARPLGTGTSFAVWAPNARGVRVVGDFNFWDGRAHPMRSLGGAGVWELYLPGVGPGTRYKYSICGPDGVWREKADPMATLAETPPATASVVYEPAYEWDDAEWMTARAARQQLTSPMSVYEVHLGSWKPGLSYRELAVELAEYVNDLGFTHVEFLPVAEHPFGGSWGYQVTSYYAPTSRYGTPDDFRYLVDTLHQAGIGVIVDWVPAHFPRDSWALAEFDGTRLYEHSDPRMGSHAGLQLRPRGGQELPRRQRHLLAGGIPHRRAAGRCRRVDALPGLLAAARGVDAERVRRPGEPGRHLVPARSQRDLLQAGARHHDDRRGIHRVARGFPAGAPWRARLRLQVEHGLDERHARVHAA
jgi:1,4-alpha-glucan branching enzyme